MITRRGGFTLIEVMVSLVITGLIALSAYAAMDAGLMTREHLDGAQRDRAQGMIARGMLEDALRHRVEPGDDEPLVRDGAGLGDVLAFDTRGVMQPHGASGLWRMEVHGATLSAHPLDATGPTLRTAMAGVQFIRVRALDGDGWHVGGRAFANRALALRVDFVAPSGEQPLPPLVVSLQPGFHR